MGKPYFMLDGISSKNTQHKYETFDGVKLNFTNWETGYEPKLWDGIIFSYENYKPFLLGKCLIEKKLEPGVSDQKSDGGTRKIVFGHF